MSWLNSSTSNKKVQMKFRIISDLHVDINKKYNGKFKFDPEAFYIIAGDTSGSRFLTTQFINRYKEKGELKKAVLVGGNHMGYNFDIETHDQTKEACYAYLAEQFPLTDDISFLDNDMKILDNGVIIIGCTLYTNYLAFNNRELGMRIGETYLNDFRYVRTYSNLGDDRLITALDYEDRFNYSIAYIDRICKEYPNNPIIVVTHHGPSKRSLNEKYANDLLSSSYVSDLDDFILEHKNIKLWCHGHVHNKARYKIGECEIIVNPFGYYNENGMKLSRYLGEVYEL